MNYINIDIHNPVFETAPALHQTAANTQRSKLRKLKMTKMIHSLHTSVMNTTPKYNYILYITKGILMLEQRQSIAYAIQPINTRERQKSICI
jgi:hypothetical protein